MRTISCKPVLVVSGLQPDLFLLPFSSFFFFPAPLIYFFLKRKKCLFGNVTVMILTCRPATVPKGTNKGNIYSDHLELKLLSHIIKSASVHESRREGTFACAGYH